jgi:hypothetical protein
MRLQANLHGAWKNLPEHDGGSEAHLLALGPAAYPNAGGMRLLDGHQVVWMWTKAQGWYRPHWYKTEERHEL